MSDLDRKITKVFAGKVVKKDLVRKVKVGANIPVFVLEYLLGKYCATDDPAAIEAGLRVVNTSIAEDIVRPNESNKMQARVRESGGEELIDKIKVTYYASDDKYWAELVNFGNKYVHVPEKYVLEYERLLVGGIWAKVKLRHIYDDAPGKRKSPFWVEDISPIQISSFDFQEYCEGRRQFDTDEWIDFLFQTIGLEPSKFDRREKLLSLMRLVPLCESNYNLIELGPRGTGKSYAYQEVSPYTILMTGPTTVANLFYHMGKNKMGLVGTWDAVAFDEVADLQKMKKEVVTTLKTYCESGRFARGSESLEGYASIAMFGNTNQPVDVMVQSSHLFVPLPEIIREDLAFLDRLHFYIPGWEIPKMRVEFFTDHYGFVVDYLAEGLKELRKYNYTEKLDHHFSLGSHLNARDVKAVRKTVSGLLKIIYPHGEFSKEEMAEIAELALEGRRRIKEQLKKMGSFEYYRTSFSYIDNETRDEVYVGVPEEGGRNLIATDPLDPGSVYTASVNEQGKVGLYRIEVGSTPGTGKLKIAGGVDSHMKESLQRAFAFIQGHKVNMGIAHQFDTTDFHVQAIDLLANRIPCEAGIALVVAIHSAVKKKSSLPALVVLGDLTIQGNIKAVRSLVEPLSAVMDNGARRVLIPIENKRNFLDVSGEIIERVDPVFYGDPLIAAIKALGIND